MRDVAPAAVRKEKARGIEWGAATEKGRVFGRVVVAGEEAVAAATAAAEAVAAISPAREVGS